MDYGLWRNANIAQNDQWPAPATGSPDRLETGPYSAADIYLSTVSPSAGTATMEVYYVCEVASQFMNLCEALNNLCHLAVETNLANWQSLVNRLKAIVNNDYIAPTKLALT